MKKKLSIIVPVYNLEKYIIRCLESLVKNIPDDNSVEILVVNDGSIDSTKDLVSNFILNYPYIKLYNKSNSGVSSTRNFGLDQAEGEYVTFVDGDDLISDNYYRVIIPKLNNHIEMLCFGYYLYFDDRIENGFCPLPGSIRVNNNDGIFQFLHLNYQKKINSIVCNKVFKLDIIKKNNIYFNPQKKFSEDLLFNVDYIQNIKKIITIDENLYLYYQRGNSVIHVYKDFFVDDTILFIDSFRNLGKKYNYEINNCDLYSFYLSRYFGILDNEVKGLKYIEGWKKIKKYIYYDGFKKKIDTVNFNNLDLKLKMYYLILKFNLTFILYNILYLKSFLISKFF